MVSAGMGVLFGALIGCLLFGFSIVIIRKTLRLLATSKSSWTTTLIPFLACIPIVFLLTLSYLFIHSLSLFSELNALLLLFFMFFVLGINIILLIPTTLFLITSFVLLLHKLIWGIMSRQIYTLQKLGIAKRNKLLSFIGVTLLVAGIGGGSDWLKAIVDKFF